MKALELIAFNPHCCHMKYWTNLFDQKPFEFATRALCFFLSIAALVIYWTAVTNDATVFTIKGIDDSVRTPSLIARLDGMFYAR
jgi:hypothetical protein